MSAEDAGFAAAELASLSAGEARSLARLAELAVAQVPGCAAAHATVWRDGEATALAATHPDAADLAELELAAASRQAPAAGDPAPPPCGPLTAAARSGETLGCSDTLAEWRWPWWAEAALCRGVRSAVHLPRPLPAPPDLPARPPMILVLALFGVRAGLLDGDSVPAAGTLAGLGGTVFANALAYGQARRTAGQLQDAVAARAVTDQAKGILMHALGCDADAALGYLRRESQRRHLKVTEVAAQVVAAHAAGGRGPL